MTKTLIFSFRKMGDILSLALPLQNYKTANPFSEITFCTYEENASAAGLLSAINKTIYLSRNRLNLLAQNKIFNKSFLVNEYYDQLSPILSEKWDVVINASNDLISTYLASAMNCQDTRGLVFDNNKATSHSCYASFVKNEVNSTFAATPVHQIDLDNYIFNNSCALTNYSKAININEAMEKVAIDELKTIRANVGRPLVAINFQAGHQSKEIPLTVVESLLSEMLEDIRFYPILILNPSDERSKSQLATLNKTFNDQLVAVEVDFKGLPSILKRVDYLITTDTSIKHLADALGTKTVEVSLGSSPFLKQGSILPGNIILSEINEFRPNLAPGLEKSFSKTYPHYSTNIKGNDIYFALLVRSGISPETISNKCGNNLTYYVVKNQSPGTTYLPFWGDIKIEHEISRIAANLFAFDVFFNTKIDSLWAETSHFFQPKEVSDFILQEKSNLSTVLKAILNCLRTVRNKDVSNCDHTTFLKNLSILVDWNFSDSLVTIPLRLFEQEIDVLSQQKNDNHFASIEKSLFNLKNKIQVLKMTLDLMNLRKANVSLSQERG